MTEFDTNSDMNLDMAEFKPLTCAIWRDMFCWLNYRSVKKSNWIPNIKCLCFLFI